MVCILFCSFGKRIHWGVGSSILSGGCVVSMSCSCGWATGSKRVGETPLETAWVSSKCSSHAWDLGPSLSQLKGQDFHWMKGTLGFVPSTSSSFLTVFTHMIGAGSHYVLAAVIAWCQETSILVLHDRSPGGGAPGWQTWVLPLCREGAYHLGEQYTESEKGRKLSMGLSWTLNHLFHWLCHFSWQQLGNLNLKGGQWISEDRTGNRMQKWVRKVRWHSVLQEMILCVSRTLLGIWDEHVQNIKMTLFSKNLHSGWGEQSEVFLT